jgi:AGZA family xanthine/uracil permease-like MFS transporter
VAPILIFIGLEITAQAFHASPPRHGPAVALTFIPVAAAVVVIEAGGIMGALGKTPGDLTGDAALTWGTLLLLGNGFILTAVLWGWALVSIVDRRFAETAALLAVASVATLFGLIHSPHPDGALFWPWSSRAPATTALAGAYGIAAALCWLAARREFSLFCRARSR